MDTAVGVHLAPGAVSVGVAGAGVPSPTGTAQLDGSDVEAVSHGLHEALGTVLGSHVPRRRLTVDLGRLVDSWVDGTNPGHLDRVTVVRLSPTETTVQEPFASWPDRLRHAIDGGWVHIPGGVDLHGGAGPAPDFDELTRRLDDLLPDGGTVCVSAMGALLDPATETAIAEHLLRTRPGIPVVMAHEAGGRRYLEREASAIFNAALQRRVTAVLEGLRAVVPAGSRLSLVRADGSRSNELETLSQPVTLLGTFVALVGQGAAAFAGEESALVAVWHRSQLRVLTVESEVLRARHLRVSSSLSGVVLAQRHAAQSHVEGAAWNDLAHDLTDRPVLLASAQEPDDAFADIAQRLTGSLPSVRILERPAAELAALGAAAALPHSEVLRYVQATDADQLRQECLAVRRLAEGRVLAATSEPLDLRLVSEHVSPLSFLPVGPALVRCHVAGRPR